MKHFIQRSISLIFILMLLTACSGGGIESNFNFDYDGFGNLARKANYYAKKAYETQLALNDQVNIRLLCGRGDVFVEGSPDAQSVSVESQLWAGSDTMADAEAQLEKLEIQVTERTDDILIRTIEPEQSNGRDYIVDYHIIIPSRMAVAVTLVSGEIDVHDVESDVTVDAVNGDVYLSNVYGNVDVELINGSIDGFITLETDGEMRMVCENGDIDLNIPMSTSALLDVSVINGSLDASNLEITDLAQTAQSLSGTLGGGEGLIELRVVSGDINILGLNG